MPCGKNDQIRHGPTISCTLSVNSELIWLPPDKLRFESNQNFTFALGRTAKMKPAHERNIIICNTCATFSGQFQFRSVPFKEGRSSVAPHPTRSLAQSITWFFGDQFRSFYSFRIPCDKKRSRSARGRSSVNAA